VFPACWEWCRVLRFPQWQQQLDGAQRSYREIGSQVVPSRTSTIHRDFYFDQVLISGPQVVLLDLDNFSLGPRGLDIGNYVAHLTEFGIRRPEHRDTCNRAAQRFIDGYRNVSKNPGTRAIRQWTQLALARHIYLSTQIADRAHTTSTLIKLVLES